MSPPSAAYLEKIKHRKPPPVDFVPETHFPQGHRLAGVKRCESWSRNAGRQCNNAAIRGKKRCKYHGGTSHGGIASGTFKTGKYSKYLPARIVSNYGAALSDPELLSLSDEIALIDARITDLLSRVDTGEAGQHWRDIRAQYELLVESIRAKNAEDINRYIGRLGSSIRAGHSDYAAWGEIVSLTDSRRKLVESQRKLLLEKQQLITSEEATVLMTSLALAVKENVRDPAVLAKIQTAFIRLSGGGDSRLTRGERKQQPEDS